MTFKMRAITAGIRATQVVSTPPATSLTLPAKKKRTKVKIEIELPGTVFDLLTAAAARRFHQIDTRMTAEQLAQQIVSGIVLRGSIDRAVALWGEYTADSRGIGAVSMGDFKAF